MLLYWLCVRRLINTGWASGSVTPEIEDWRGGRACSQVPYPKLQEFLFLAARQDTLPPSVFQPIRRLGDEQ